MRHRRRVLAALSALLLCLAVVSACSSQPVADPSSAAPRPTTAAGTGAGSTPAATTPAATPTLAGDPTQNPSGTTTAPTTDPPPNPTPATMTPGGMWWGVDSSGPMNAAALDAVQDWYQGATPQMWGRYIVGHYAVDAGELAFARAHGIYVYLLVPDENCSVCDGGRDLCGQDTTAAQAVADGQAALAAARAVAIKPGARLFKDIEQVGSCRGEPTATYMQSWYRSLAGSGYRVGFYGNSYRQNYDFPRAYCSTVAIDPDFAANVIMDANEPEPAISAPRNTVGPATAPAFAPYLPSCATQSSTYLWQYGESTSRDNYADIDQARPDTPGLLAPDGSITGA